MELRPSNHLAWHLYADAQMPIGHLLGELEEIELTRYEAGDLAAKLRALHIKVAEIERIQAKEAEQSARNAARSGSR